MAYIALGSNCGDRAEHLRRARERIGTTPGVRILRESTIEETAPIGPAGQGPYLNQMLAIETTLEPHTLLDALQVAEDAGGRERSVRWGARTIDIDIVMFEQQTCTDDRLVVPHREFERRDFWQRELAELRATNE